MVNKFLGPNIRLIYCFKVMVHNFIEVEVSERKVPQINSIFTPKYFHQIVLNFQVLVVRLQN
jgi:hypothetical protein